MKIDITEAQARHFNDNKQILFEEVLSSKERELLSSQSLGKELWRKEDGIKKIALSKKIGDIALGLTVKHSMRLLFDCVTSEPLELSSLPYQGAFFSFSFDFITQEEKFHLEDVPVKNLSYIAVYGEACCLYIKGKSSYTFPKTLGYEYGDRLLSKDFPYLIK